MLHWQWDQEEKKNQTELNINQHPSVSNVRDNPTTARSSMLRLQIIFNILKPQVSIVSFDLVIRASLGAHLLCAHS